MQKHKDKLISTKYLPYLEEAKVLFGVRSDSRRSWSWNWLRIRRRIILLAAAAAAAFGRGVYYHIHTVSLFTVTIITRYCTC